MIYGYIRVSTVEQNTQNQRLEISKSWQVDEWVEEQKSGTIDYRKRNLGELIEKMKEGDTLVITELSRLGRSLTMIFNIISILKDKKIRCVAIKNNFDLNPTNPNDIISSVLLFAFGLSAQIERQLISDRTKQGIAVARAKGKKIGRAKGEKPRWFKLSPYKAEIESLLEKGVSINALAKMYNVRWLTMKNFIKTNRFIKDLPPLTQEPRRHGHPSRREKEWFEKHA